MGQRIVVAPQIAGCPRPDQMGIQIGVVAADQRAREIKGKPGLPLQHRFPRKRPHLIGAQNGLGGCFERATCQDQSRKQR
jgi:hypothetical protein